MSYAISRPNIESVTHTDLLNLHEHASGNNKIRVINNKNDICLTSGNPLSYRFVQCVYGFSSVIGLASITHLCEQYFSNLSDQYKDGVKVFLSVISDNYDRDAVNTIKNNKGFTADYITCGMVKNFLKLAMVSESESNKAQETLDSVYEKLMTGKLPAGISASIIKDVENGNVSNLDNTIIGRDFKKFFTMHAFTNKERAHLESVIIDYLCRTVPKEKFSLKKFAENTGATLTGYTALHSNLSPNSECFRLTPQDEAMLRDKSKIRGADLVVIIKTQMIGMKDKLQSLTEKEKGFIFNTIVGNSLNESISAYLNNIIPQPCSITENVAHRSGIHYSNTTVPLQSIAPSSASRIAIPSGTVPPPPPLPEQAPLKPVSAVINPAIQGSDKPVEHGRMTINASDLETARKKLKRLSTDDEIGKKRDADVGSNMMGNLKKHNLLNSDDLHEAILMRREGIAPDESDDESFTGSTLSLIPRR